MKSGREILKALYKASRHFGIVFRRQGKGDHVVLSNRHGRNFSVPLSREVHPGTLLKIISDACMTKEDFLKFDP